jgi:hypothetical protein
MSGLPPDTFCAGQSDSARTLSCLSLVHYIPNDKSGFNFMQ